jgi:hypothetical protein
MRTRYTRALAITAVLLFAGLFAYRLATPKVPPALPTEAPPSAAELPSTVAADEGVVRIRDQPALAKFAARKHVALTIALTPQQAEQEGMRALAERLAQFYQKQGRVVSPVARVEPGSVVESLQPLASPHHYPRWKTIPSDLILFGTPADNVLLMDQARGQIFPLDLAAQPGKADVVYTRSPFVGEYDVLNVIAADLAVLERAVNAIIAPARGS